MKPESTPSIQYVHLESYAERPAAETQTEYRKNGSTIEERIPGSFLRSNIGSSRGSCDILFVLHGWSSRWTGQDKSVDSRGQDTSFRRHCR